MQGFNEDMAIEAQQKFKINKVFLFCRRKTFKF